MSARYLRSVADATDFLIQAPLLDKDNAPIVYQRDIDQLVVADPESSSASAPTLKRLPDATTSVQTIRRRCTIAEINAGVTLLAAAAGWKYRMVNCKAIAIGGAAGTVTTVDVLATQSASGVKLAAFAQASLTRSTVLTAGGSGGAVLADGASYVDNDVNTAITVGKTGGAIDTATHVDIIFDYVLTQG